MASNINGNALTLEQKIMRKLQGEYMGLASLDSEEETKAFLNSRRFTNFEIIRLISDALEEMFEP